MAAPGSPRPSDVHPRQRQFLLLEDRVEKRPAVRRRASVPPMDQSHPLAVSERVCESSRPPASASDAAIEPLPEAVEASNTLAEFWPIPDPLKGPRQLLPQALGRAAHRHGNRRPRLIVQPADSRSSSSASNCLRIVSRSSWSSTAFSGPDPDRPDRSARPAPGSRARSRSAAAPWFATLSRTIARAASATARADPARTALPASPRTGS